jgi:hypothetical protein
MRASLSPDRYPEPRLKQARRVEIQDAARDVIVFRGHTIWHLRENPANTTMLYLKLNAFNCDPLGEDRRTPLLRQQTETNSQASDQAIVNLVPQLGRRIDYIHRMYTRDWREVAGVVLWNEKHFTVDEDELKMLQAMDGRRTVESVAAAAIAGGADRAATLEKVRRLARRGVIELLGKAK